MHGGFPIGFTNPWWLALLALLPLAWWLERRSLVLVSEARRRAALLMRTLVIVLLVLALAGMRVERRSDDLAVIFAIDKSESVSDREIERALAQVNEALAARRQRDQAGVIVFGEDALVERSPGPLQKVEKLESVPRRSFTDIAKAVRLAVGLFPEGAQRRIVLFTDGNENLGNGAGEANVAAANEIPIDVVPLTPSAGEEVLVEGVQVPERLEKKKPFDVKITVRSTYAGEATLRLYKDRNFIGQSEVNLTEGKNIFVFPQSEPDAGFHTYEAMVDTPRDTVRDNNQSGAYTLVYGEPRVLLVGADDDTRFLKDALVIENIPVDTAQNAPATLADAENYDAIFLCNVGAEYLTNPQLKLLQLHCGELGGGLAMTGGEDSFGLGGYRNTPVEEALPVSMDIKNKKNFPSLGLMMLVDKSGSMSGILPGSGRQKVELAAEAAVAALEALTERDHIGVIGFDSAAKWDCPFQPATDKPALANVIRSLRAGGGTDAIPAFNQAISTFGSAALQLKHIILISDGMVQPGDYQRVTQELNGLKVTVTAVGIGPDADRAFMERLATDNGGRAYFTSDPNAIPRIFTKETVIAQRSYLVEEKFTPVQQGSNEILKGMAALPALTGYVATEEKDRAETLLKSPRGDAVLAAWRYRAGKSLAWTSDARDRWAADWVTWPEFKKFWGQATRWVMRSRKPGVLNPRVAVENGVGRISVDAVNDKGEFVNFLTLDASVMTPALDAKRLTLRQTGAGHYEAEFDAREVGTYLASVTGDKVDPATAGASVGYPPEYRSLKPNQILMEQVAAATGGRMSPATKDFFRRDGARVQTVRGLWYHLLWLALLLFLADIAARRLFLDDEQRAQIAAFLRRLVPVRSGREIAGAAAGTLDTLKQRRGQVQQRLKSRGVDKPATEATGSLVEALERTRKTTRDTGGETAKAGTTDTKPPPTEPASPGTATPAAGETHTFRLLEARRRAREKKEK
jgi:uncharacterized membrane protein/secreted protein with Ig-like and vWFA domain